MDNNSEIYSTVIGIDLGTTNSCVGIWKVINGMGNPEILPSNESGKLLTPSCISFRDTQELIGQSALCNRITNRQNTIFDMKRLIGRSFNDEFVQKMIGEWPFKVVSDENGNPLVEIKRNGKTEQISATQMQTKILRKMREIAELRLGHPVRKAVITIPAYFGQGPRQETRKAALDAGFELVWLLHEPTAAAYFYGFHQQRFHGYNLLVFDLGGGTFDCTVLNVRDGNFDTLAIDGIENLGGRDFDQCLMELTREKIYAKHKKDASADPKTSQKLLLKCQKMKEYLSTINETGFDLQELFYELDFEIKVSRDEFNKKCRPLMELCMDKVRSVLENAELRSTQIDHVLLVGGGSRIPLIMDLLSKVFGKEKINCSVNLDMAVAYGATIRAGQFCEQVKHSAPANMDIHEATPLSIGVDGFGDKFVKLIHRNSKLPICAEIKFIAEYKFVERNYHYNIYEGERPIASKNNYLGIFKLQGIKPKPSGEINNLVTLRLDKDGILHADAYNEFNDKRVALTIDYGESSLATKRGSNAVGNMMMDAKLNEAEDSKEVWRIEAMLEIYKEINKQNFILSKKIENNPDMDENERRICKYKLQQCKIFDDWYSENEKKATREEFMEKLDEFQLAISNIPLENKSEKNDDSGENGEEENSEEESSDEEGSEEEEEESETDATEDESTEAKRAKLA